MRPGTGSSAATDETLRMRPPPAARRWGTAVRVATNGAWRLIAISSSCRAIGMSGKLSLRDRAQAVVLAYETGLVSPGDHAADE